MNPSARARQEAALARRAHSTEMDRSELADLFAGLLPEVDPAFADMIREVDPAEIAEDVEGIMRHSARLREVEEGRDGTDAAVSGQIIPPERTDNA